MLPSTAKGWFVRRVRSEWRFQKEVFGLAVDWVVALYIVIPAIGYVVYQYIQWWIAAPAWFASIPLYYAASMLFMATRVGTIRYMLEEADQLVLLHTSWYERFKRYGMWYSFILHGCGIVFIMGIVAPLWFYQYDISATSFILLAVFVFAHKMIGIFVHQYISMKFNGFTFHLLNYIRIMCLAVLMFGGVYFMTEYAAAVGVVFLFVVLCVLIALARLRLVQKSGFFQDVKREKEQRLKYLALLLAQGQVDTGKPKSRRRRPWLFRSSNRLFRERTQESGLAELRIKTMFRNSSTMKAYWQVVGVIALGILLTPHLFKWLFCLLALIILCTYARSFWKDGQKAQFLKLFQWREGVDWRASRKGIFYMVLPGVLILVLLASLMTLPWWALVPALALSTGISYVAADTFRV